MFNINTRSQIHSPCGCCSQAVPSTGVPAYQAEAAARLHLPYPLLSDAARAFSGPLRLPSFVNGGTSFLRHGRVVHVQYPVFPPDGSADAALTWLRNQPARSG